MGKLALENGVEERLVFVFFFCYSLECETTFSNRITVLYEQKGEKKIWI